MSMSRAEQAFATAVTNGNVQTNDHPHSRADTPYRVPYSDTYNAEEMARRHGQRLRYCATWHRWFIWQGTHWQWDDMLQVYALARDTLKALGAEALQAENEPLLKHVAKSFSTHALHAMVDQLRSFPGIATHHEAFDTHRWLFNCRNGTIDLRTGQLLDPDPAHLITKCAPVVYDPAASCPQWRAFLWHIMGGPSAAAPDEVAYQKASRLCAYLQRALGMALSGQVMEKALFLCHGSSGNNGKSTLLETIGKILGPDYAKSPPMEIWLANKEKEPETALATLRGVRFAWNVEPDEGRRLSLNTLKKLSGGDTVSARFLYGEPFTFEPEATFFLGANNTPPANAEDDPFWNRLKTIPFDVAIPKEEQDKELKTRLITEEAAGIMSWLVRGCLAWQEQGLGEPTEVLQATAAYRSENDTVQLFLDECCYVNPQASCKAGRLYEAYAQWTADKRPLSQTKFGGILKKKGIQRSERSNAGYTYFGVGLTAPPGESPRNP